MSSYVAVSERRVQARAAALARCERGYHRMKRTFRPGEEVCTVCALVTYCPECLVEAHLSPVTSTRAFAQPCLLHHATPVTEQQEVQA